MTQMIYRGVAHDGRRSPATPGPFRLVYRGIAHDGRAAQPASPARGHLMSYRGVRFVLKDGQPELLAAAADGRHESRTPDLALTH